MGLRHRRILKTSSMVLDGMLGNSGKHSSSPFMKYDDQRRPMILKWAKIRSKDYPSKATASATHQVLRARTAVYHGVSTLLRYIPIWTCKYCPEVHVGVNGHLIRTSAGYGQESKNEVHEWIPGGLDDVLVPSLTPHSQNKFLDSIKHQGTFNFSSIPAVVELCLRTDPNIASRASSFAYTSLTDGMIHSSVDEFLSDFEMRVIATGTFKAWQSLRHGVEKLVKYQATVYSLCPEPDMNDHVWRKAKVDDFVRSNMVWCQRARDPLVLVDEGRDFYGRAHPWWLCV